MPKRQCLHYLCLLVATIITFLYQQEDVVSMHHLRFGASAWCYPSRVRRSSLAHITRSWGCSPNEYAAFATASNYPHWKGSIVPCSDYADHVLVGEQDAPISVNEAIRNSMGPKVAMDASINASQIPRSTEPLSPLQLLELGSVWYLSSGDYQRNSALVGDVNEHSSRVKPSRLAVSNATLCLQKGDYLRIHHTPRRYPQVYSTEWKVGACDSVIAHESNDHWIVNKPPLVPVHGTVDNALENVVHQLAVANQQQTDYVATTQRLDINTSGLLVVAKSKAFAAYFAQQLRHKTKQNDSRTSHMTKGYKCLVCLLTKDDGTSTTLQEWQSLQQLVGTTICHYLEPSDRAPKRFEMQAGDDSWFECRMKVTHVSHIAPITPLLETSLWTQSHVPPGCKAVAEVLVELDTGRTHQIRGQMAKLGFPLVGDEQYGGAIPTETTMSSSVSPQLLALQCSNVGFWEPNYQLVWNDRRRRNVSQGVPSDRWVSATLDRAWWSPLLEQSQTEASDDTTSLQDIVLVKELQSTTSRHQAEEQLDFLPPRVQLSQGKNKYILVKVKPRNGNEGDLWFVKSASPTECGGPYHANVAKELVEWIHAAGFDDVTVTGGGRIDYSEARREARVYGFSYSFGKGDHAKAAELIQEATGIRASFDNRDDLY